MQTIQRSIDISASPKKVWEVLFNDQYNTFWLNEFMEGTRAETNWKLGAKVIFTDKKKDGVVGIIKESNPPELLSIEYEGVVVNGVEDYDSPKAKAMKGFREIYTLANVNGETQLSILGDMEDEYFDMMSGAWDRALQTIKNLSEK